MIQISLLTKAVVDVANLKYNIEKIKEKISSETKICAVVKDDAYGHGAAGIAVRLERSVDYFAVALVEEGVALRLAGITKPVLVLIPTDEEGAERGIRYGLELAVGSLHDISVVSAAARVADEKARVHIKVDTGMNRLGFAPKDLRAACKILRADRGIEVVGCFSHLFDPSNEETNERQFEKFLFAKHTIGKFFHGVIFHLAASGGIIAGKKYHFDMVRPGILLYGYRPFKEADIDVKPILKIKGKKLADKVIFEGESFLYGNFRAEKREEVSLVRAGYGDGLPRDFGTLNNLCMDTGGFNPSADEWVTVFDDADKIAEAKNTIPYEILCGLCARAHTEYIEQ